MRSRIILGLALATAVVPPSARGGELWSIGIAFGYAHNDNHLGGDNGFAGRGLALAKINDTISAGLQGGYDGLGSYNDITFDSYNLGALIRLGTSRGRVRPYGLGGAGAYWLRYHSQVQDPGSARESELGVDLGLGVQFKGGTKGDSRVGVCVEGQWHSLSTTSTSTGKGWIEQRLEFYTFMVGVTLN